MSFFRKKPLAKNLCLSLTGKEPVFNNFTLYNNFPIGLMIISKLDPISSRVDMDDILKKQDIEEQEIEIKLKYINQHARDLFDLKDSDNSSRIKECLKIFKSSDKNTNFDESDNNLCSTIFNIKDQNEFYGSFKSQAMLIWVKFRVKKDDIYICADYFSDERKTIQNELFKSIKFQYIATLFHELYNPINAILVMMEQNKADDEDKNEIMKNNFDYQNYISEIDASNFSLITENELDKINFNFNSQINENNENISIKKLEKFRKLEGYYKNQYYTIKEREKDVCLLVSMIYIFLENLILYLRLNIGDDKENNNDKNKSFYLSVLNSKLNDDYSIENNENEPKDKNKKFRGSQTQIIPNKALKNIYEDNYFSSGKANKKVNLQLSFTKHLNRFSYLFKFKNIQYFKDYSFLSDKYIFTDETIFSDFLSQIYSFLYYVVPKFHGFEVSFNIVNDNKIKLTFQKTNVQVKSGYRYKKFQKKDSFILLGNKFKATNTVKTAEMTIEILYKLAETLGITVKIMEYEDQKEDKYLTIMIPFVIGKKFNYLNSNNTEELGDISSGDKLIEKIIKNSENFDENNLDNNNMEEICNKTNIIINDFTEQIGDNNKGSKKVSFYIDDKNTFTKENNINDINDINDNNNCNCKDININNNNINNFNINININKNININNNFNSSSLSLISNDNSNKIPPPKSMSENNVNINSTKNKVDINNLNNISKVEKGKNILTLIHEKYSFIDRLKSGGVEILTENNDKNVSNIDYYDNKTNADEDNNKNRSDEQNSAYAEADSENYIEIENDDGISEEIIFNNNNVNKSSDTSKEAVSKSFNMNRRKEKITTILKHKKSLINKKINKALSYNKVPKDILFVIPEISENVQKEQRINIHPSSKLNHVYANEFTACDCNDILLVDDDEFICKTFKNILKKFNLKADTAENGKECLKLIQEKIEKDCKCDKNKYKIIFMDITMPVMDGIEAAKNIQQMIDEKKIYDSLKIIFISAHANLDLSSTISGIKCAVDYHAKPISADKYKHLLDKYYYGNVK